MPSDKSVPQAALIVLIILQVTMLGALFSKTVPHPPLAIAPFALGPFLGASIAVAAAALALGSMASRAGTIVALGACVLGLLSLGPQKWIDPNIARIWPAVLLGQIAVAALIYSAFRCRKPAD